MGSIGASRTQDEKKLASGLFRRWELEAEIMARVKFGLRTVRFTSRDPAGVSAQIERLGHVPLPPLI